MLLHPLYTGSRLQRDAKEATRYKLVLTLTQRHPVFIAGAPTLCKRTQCVSISIDILGKRRRHENVDLLQSPSLELD